MRSGRRLMVVLWVALFAYLTYILFPLAVYDDLSSTANDSVNYLVMARHYSPWFSEDAATRFIWGQQDFPPVFPLLLAVTATSHSLLSAHVLVIIIGLLSLMLAAMYARKVLQENIYAFAIVVIFGLSPGFILGLQGILSEAFYLFLSLAFLLGVDTKNRRKVLVVGVILGLLLATRTIGYSMAAAVLVYTVIDYLKTRKIATQNVVIVFVGLLVYALIMLSFGPEKESHYGGQFKVMFEQYTNSGIDIYIVQLTGLFEAWHSFWSIYWLDELSIRHVFLSTVLVLAMLGLARRIYLNKVDAWYVSIYLLILISWPHPGQMVRLIFPVIPILVIYAINGLVWGLSKINLLKPAPKSVFLFCAIFLVSVLPAHAFIHGRMEVAAQYMAVPVYEALRSPSLQDAERDIITQKVMLEAYKKVAEYASENDIVGYFEPAYIAVLSGRKSQQIDYPVSLDPSLRGNDTNELRFLLLTEMHPRKTRLGYSGFEDVESLSAGWSQLWCYEHDKYGKLACMYKRN